MRIPIRPVKLDDSKENLLLIDQTKLPQEEVVLAVYDTKDIWEAINSLRVRGAPAIGVAAAFAMYLAAKHSAAKSAKELLAVLKNTSNYLSASRPTAVNLFWALNRMYARAEKEKDNAVETIVEVLLEESESILQEDLSMGRAIGENGLSVLKSGMSILTHCNAGALATSGYGTALAPIYLGHERKYSFKVYADETRPLLQGSRLTAYELVSAGVDTTVICDNMVSYVMRHGLIDAVLVGCDRVAANGDTANKIGTSGVAILAKEYGIPFYVLGPTSTFDLSIKTGKDIVIEQRNPEEITEGFGKKTAPENVKALNPAFDITDAKYITAIITEEGILYPPYERKIENLLNKKSP